MEDREQKNKFLMVATVASMIGQFNMDNLQILLDMGCEVHVACNFNDVSVWTKSKILEFEKRLYELGVKTIHIEFARNPLNVIKLVQSYIQLRKIVKREKYKVLHCHTPVAGMIARLTSIFTDTKVIYTAHGFHFFDGAPLKNWLIFYPVERICALLTDVLITINKEDYNRAVRFGAKKVEYVPGVGVDVTKISTLQIDKEKVRAEVGVCTDDYVILSVGELSARKNHEVIIRALKKIEEKKVKYLICGVGEREKYLRDLVEQLDLQGRVVFAGYRNNIHEILHVVDCFAFPSLQEGLPVALMEAMAAGLPIVCSKIRGNVDLIVDEKNGYLCKADDVDAFASRIKNIMVADAIKFKINNTERIKENDVLIVHEKMQALYSSII